MRHHYLVAYDICDEHRLRRVHATVRDFGQAIQYSVFLAILTDSQKAELKRRLANIINHADDQILLFDLGRATGQHQITVPAHEPVGRPLKLETRRFVVV